MIKVVKETLEKAAKKHKVKPYQVSSTQFWTTLGSKLSEWHVRKNGGLSNIQKALWDVPKENTLLPTPKMDKKFKMVIPKLESFTVHGENMDQLFKQAGLKDHEVFRVVVQPDTHVPEYDKAAMSVFCDFLDFYKPHGLINLGDFMEMESVAHWEPMLTRARRFVPEVKVGKEVLEMIGDAAGKQCKFKKFITGNHEYWLQMYLTQKIPEVFDGIEDLDIKLDLNAFLGLEKLGYGIIPINEILGVGQASFIHGYYTGTHHAAKHLSVFGCNIYYGHVHDVQSHSGVSVRGLHEAMSLGCLRTLNAPFLKGKPQNWSHAFGVFEFRKDGTYTRYAPIIVNGSFSFAGRIFSA